MAEHVTIDGNEAVANVAYALSEVVAIYPITPASPMGEWADQWASEGRPNLWGTRPSIIEMQSEGGAAGAVHGSLQAGSLTTTFTASQGLLLMLPNMYKIAGELTPTVFHVAARSVAAQALSIFCDHSDVMAARGTGFALLSSASVQEAADFAAIAHAATLESRIPFLHFMDGFRTSHELAKIQAPSDEVLRDLIQQEWIHAHRNRALTPDRPVIRGTAQNPDVFFQARETVNPFYLAAPSIVQGAMDRFAELSGRRYRLFEYVGHPEAERVVVAMGSACDTAEETVRYLVDRGESVGLVRVHLYRPFSADHFLDRLPATTRAIGVLDRTKEPGAIGEPLYQDIITAVYEKGERFNALPKTIGGRYGLSSKELTPAMVKAVLDELKAKTPKNHFTVGINDDVTHTSLDYETTFSTAPVDVTCAVFYGLGSDGTVGANKNSIKIVGERTDGYSQGFFVYDSKKAGSVTVSHLRFSHSPIQSSYLVEHADFVACHHFPLLERYDVLGKAKPGATFLLNSPYGPDEVWDTLPYRAQRDILDKALTFYVIDGYGVARDAGLGRRINTVMQTCFFAITELMPLEEAVAAIKQTIETTYGKRGQPVIERNYAAVDSALDHLYQVPLDTKTARAPEDGTTLVPANAPEFVRNVTSEMILGRGDALPVSALPVDGTFPTGTAKYEKRNIAQEIPAWDPDICIQCGKCVLVCPHGVIRSTICETSALADAPETFKSSPSRWRDFSGEHYVLQVAPEDCTGCTLCVEVCPVKNKRETRLKAINMQPQAPLREQERENWEFFLRLSHKDRDLLHHNRVRDVQLLEPLFEFSGACAGCGETPYLKLMTQLFGDRSLVANATGCSSIYGGNLPTTPWTKNAEGHGPAWANSLFEDNAEFGLGMRVALDKQVEYARELLQRMANELGDDLVRGLLDADQSTEHGIREQRRRVQELKERIRSVSSPNAHDLLTLADTLIRKDVWIVGGDGWAYDIGFGGLDHVLASGLDINVLVLDTEVYSNTGGQMSKATPRAAMAKFAAAGKPLPKKDLGQIAMTYGNVYVAQIAMGADDTQALHALQEAEAYSGSSLIIAYSHCIAHGYDLAHGLDQQRAAVRSGYWPLYRYHPSADGHGVLELDSKAPDLPLKDYIYKEGRYRMLAQSQPERAKELLKLAQQDVHRRWSQYEKLTKATATTNEEA